MFPYLDFAVVAFVLFAGFGFGVLLGWTLRERESRTTHDGDGGEPVPVMQPVADARAVDRLDDTRLAEIIPFPGRRRAG
jgi:hypothetical protein